VARYPQPFFRCALATWGSGVVLSQTGFAAAKDMSEWVGPLAGGAGSGGRIATALIGAVAELPAWDRAVIFTGILIAGTVFWYLWSAADEWAVKDLTPCVVCLARPPSHVVLDCGHKCVCKSCAEEVAKRLGQCPKCRGQISRIVRVYE